MGPRADRIRSSSSLLGLIAVGPLVEELGARHDALDQHAEPMAAAVKPRPERLDRRVVAGQEAAAQRVGQELAAQVLDELPLAPFLEVGTQAVDPGPLAASREARAGVN